MMNTTDRLKTLRVGDVMTKDVVPVSSYQTMGEAAATLVEHAISGAPVIDEKGHCVGVLSAADFVCRENATSHASSSLASCEKEVVRDPPGGAWCVEDVFSDRVCSHMTSTLQTVDAGTSLIDAGRVMCAEHIHRLPVLDETAHPVGMLTSLDIVAAVVQAVDEAEQVSAR